MKLEFRQSFAKDLKGKDPETLKRLKSLIEELEDSDSLRHIANVKNLRGTDSYYRIRMGNYRLGLRQEDNKIVVLRFLHRKEIYRYFP
uniref:mRNA interferase RelE/StbE n=1 Tax=Candidatus Kentrum sp. DK TaxID=2126562 RepID=A0A450TAZ5_9GAMM|nr:MAG: mRNA interferase RelE/StbE [Candidatus Kentron sp. DK]